VPSTVRRAGLPGVHQVVAAAFPRCDPSTSGLPARGFPKYLTVVGGLSSVDLFHVYPSQGPKKSLDFHAMKSNPALQDKRPASTASAIRLPSAAPAVMASQQWDTHSATPCGVPVRYAARAPR
jgi:hypothetical protein